MMTVKEISELTGISVRTLHYYDEIGLFTPTEKSEAGYRLYDDKALETLQQILFFREFGIPLKEIKAVMDNPTLDRDRILQMQRKMLETKKKRIERLLSSIDNILKGDTKMDFTVFDETEISAMENQLSLIAKSYDRGIDLGRKGIDPYKNFPSYITNHPYFPLFQQMEMNETLSDSGRKEIVEYLVPKVGMKFIDLGCCLNYMFRGYKDWPSTYYGVDISSKTIELLHEFTEKNNLTVGDLYCGSMHETPYDTNFFDIGECIGSLEYFEKDFVQLAVAEFHRILKADGKFVLDIPNVGTPEFEITKLIEEYLGRPDIFNLSVKEFETILDAYFIIDKKEIVGPMLQYFLVCKK